MAKTPEGARNIAPRVVIVGGGFGGLAASKALANSSLAVTLVDQHNYHLFQPLLYQVATAGLAPSDIASPIRAILRRARNIEVILEKVSGIDTEKNEVIAQERRIPFDDLIIATGAQGSYFGHDAWAEYAPGLKTLDDAIYLRRRILLAFEKAEVEPDAQERRRLMNFVIVGGGPTGVELAGAVAELAKKALARDFHVIDPRQANIILVEAGPRILPSFDPSLSEAAKQELQQLGVTVRESTEVTGCDTDGVTIGQDRIETRTILWAAGVTASPAGRWLGVDTDHVGRVPVGPDLSVPGHPNIFVIGDTAHAVSQDGKPLPGVAPVAKQQGYYVAALLRARLKGKTLPPFRYRDYGELATVGRSRAVVELGKFKFRGFLGWLLWCGAHIYFLIGFRNRLFVALNWAWDYVTFQRGTRLITGVSSPRMEDVPRPRQAAQPAQHTKANAGRRQA